MGISKKADPEVQASSLIWERTEPTSRSAPAPMSRERIVRAAVALADNSGLEAVSLRGLAAALGSGPMRLYAYIATREELLDLMADAIYGELLAAGDLRGNWRVALRSHANRMRSITKKHPWFVNLLGSRPHMGPNGLQHLEMALASLYKSTEFRSIDEVIRAMRTVNAYMVGAIQAEASEFRSEQASGLTKSQWRTVMGPYLRRMIGTGRFPTLAKVFIEAEDSSRNQEYEIGLEYVLDGIAARMKA